MTIIEKSTFTGVNQSECRPFARVRMGQQLKAVAEDQAYAYKSLTGQAVPNAPGVDVAANHIHDGTNGAPIPIPVSQGWLAATLDRPPNVGGYVPLLFFPFFAPPGFDTYQLNLFTRTPEQLGSMVQASVLNDSLQTTSGGVFTRQTLQEDSLGGGVFVISSTLTVTPDRLNVLRLEANESNTAPPAVDFLAYTLTPYFGDPDVRALGYDYPDTNENIVAPDTTEHLGAHAFTSYDDGMFNDDDAVSSYLVNTMNKNNVYLMERVTGLAAGNRDTTTDTLYQGHSHAGSTSPSAKASNVGALIDHSIGAWAYGARRASSVGGVTFGYFGDMADNANTTWSGRIVAPTLKIGTTSSQSLFYHPVRLPLLSGTGDYAHSTGKLKAAFLVYTDNSKNGVMTINARMASVGLSAFGTSQNVTTSGTGDGVELLTISGLDAQGTTSGEVEQNLRIDMALTTNASLGSALYGSCLWVEV